MTKDWRRLGELAAGRRAELGLTQIEVAQRGPLSLDRVQSIEGAKRTSYRLGTLVALERALEWASGSVDEILAGGEPTPRRFQMSTGADEARHPRDQSHLDEDLRQRPGESGRAYLKRMIDKYVEEDSPQEQALRTILESWKNRDAG